MVGLTVTLFQINTNVIAKRFHHETEMRQVNVAENPFPVFRDEDDMGM